MKNIDFYDVALYDGFWNTRYALNRDVSIPSVHRRFAETGRMAATGFDVMPEGTRRHVFYDSDVVKWMEGVCHVLAKEPEAFPGERETVEVLIGRIAANQREDGYFNSYFQNEAPERIFSVRNDHELYCAGHLMEAAVAHRRATGRDDFLAVAERLAACIKRAFVTERTAAFLSPGHEELEYALILLYEETGKEEYLELAGHFLKVRGTEEDRAAGGILDWLLPSYAQHECPVYELEEANGHAVRAVYLYMAMARYAYHKQDAGMQAAVERLFESIERRMYITGGIGSSRLGETFTKDYDLPNLEAYSESCAAIGLWFFAREMQLFGRNSRYGDTIERILYNSFLSSTSLDGKCFFYENPLEICLEECGKETSIVASRRTVLPPATRVEVFDCSCCPPNINRAIPRMPGTVFSLDERGLLVNQFISCSTDVCGHITVSTDYPVGDTVHLRGRDYPYSELAVRRPWWCDAVEVSAPYTEKNGFLCISVGAEFDVTVRFELAPRFWQAHPAVRADAGRVAVSYGPIIYCMEAVDNGERLNALLVDSSVVPTVTGERYGGLPVLTAAGYRELPLEGTYHPLGAVPRIPVTLRLIPYCTFANRGASDMLVWMRYC